ncbi:MAG: phage portal protein, partial [Mariprofundaceae bacterium]|nr:phage portal protein [Mariprofundaceae bacterium]
MLGAIDKQTRRDEVMDALQQSLARTRGIVSAAHSRALQMKDAGVLAETIAMSGAGNAFGNFKNQGADRQRYGLFRGWLYAAINALASEAAGQSVHLGRLLGAEPNPELRAVPPARKAWFRSRMTATAESKTAHGELEVIQSHPLLDSLERPNPVQHRWQFVYNFVANLNLTGWSYIIGDTDEDGRPQFYALPTTWIKPDHKEGPFSRFFIVDPKKPTGDMGKEPLDRTQVAFAHLPNPSDPLSALAPAQAQIMAIRIDDHIQASQERFFENGIFPSVIVTIGKNPHPDVPGGVRPRLSGAQRRQVHGAIRKEMSTVANYGNPAIVDGLIESITRLSATQNEMGWEKSERVIKERILSAFAVHEYILGASI